MQQTVENIKEENRQKAKGNIVAYLDEHRPIIENLSNEEIADNVLDGVRDNYPDLYENIIA